MRRIDVAGVLVIILAGVGATRGRAQTPALVSPSSTLPVTAALQSSAVTLAVSLAQPAVLVPLGDARRLGLGAREQVLRQGAHRHGHARFPSGWAGVSPPR